MAPPLLTLRDINLTFGSNSLLEGAELYVSQRDRVCLVGRNGSGKSTLLKIAAGLVEADSGEKFLQPGTTVRYLPQEPNFSDFETTLDYAQAGCEAGDDPYQAIYLLEQLNKLINDQRLSDIFFTSGHPAWSFLHIKEQAEYSVFEIKTFFLQEMFKRGILTLGSHNLSFSHTKKEVDKLLEVYAEVLPIIKQCIDNQALLENIQGDILKPLFKVR